jgi:hypothetical protein
MKCLKRRSNAYYADDCDDVSSGESDMDVGVKFVLLDFLFLCFAFIPFSSSIQRCFHHFFFGPIPLSVLTLPFTQRSLQT